MGASLDVFACVASLTSAQTNTRITDVETMERRYPVLVRKFSLREKSGGTGKYSGGDGCVRDIEFLEPVQVSILSERRVFAPFGLEGGGDGKRGRNTWVKRARADDGDLPNSFDEEGESEVPTRRINLGGKQTVAMGAGDRIVIETPGAGAWGAVEETSENDAAVPSLLSRVLPASLQSGAPRGSLVQRMLPDF